MFKNAKHIALMLTDQGIHDGTMVKKTDTPREGGNKIKFGGHKKGNSHQGSHKKQSVVTVYAATPVHAIAPVPQKQYSGTLLKCNK